MEKYGKNSCLLSSGGRKPIRIVNECGLVPTIQRHFVLGVIYAVIINLSRNITYSEENVMIIGIPGPKEPKKHINSFLGPLVSELLEFYSGIWLTTSAGRQFVRCVLVCQSSNIPATRKAAGFLGHNVNKVCSRCLKPFPKVMIH